VDVRLLSEGIIFDFWKAHNACYIDRFVPDSPKADRFQSMVLLTSTYIVVGLIILLASLKQKINFLKACYMTAMNLGGYCFVIFLKEYIADNACNQSKANSVSGHFAFYFFHLLTLPFIWSYSHWPADGEPYGAKPKISENKPMLLNAIRFVYFIFVCITSWTLYRTFVYGFHSPAQCVNGAIFAVIMHLACVHLMRHLDDPTEKAVLEARRPRPSLEEVETDVPLIVFGLFNALSIILAYVWHGTIPLDTWELFLNVGAWARILWGP
jgi:hypothetical protein